ncbi:MAG: tRNA (adenosine(37)-N6)-threonylcarbamoyltransferase complex dimerization subunit type 1 TsaB [bacterium]
MAILSIDSCLAACSVAILEGQDSLFCQSDLIGRGHAEYLPQLVARAFADSKRTMVDIDLVTVTVGPGSFTGLRVGLAFARALRLGYQTKIVGVSTLEVLAAAAATSLAAREITQIIPLIDARRGQVYGQLFDHKAKSTSDAFVLEPKQALDYLQLHTDMEQCLLVGNGVPLVFPERIEDDDWDRHMPDPIILARCGAQKKATATGPKPLYIRGPDAKKATI